MPSTSPGVIRTELQEASALIGAQKLVKILDESVQLIRHSIGLVPASNITEYTSAESRSFLVNNRGRTSQRPPLLVNAGTYCDVVAYQGHRLMSDSMPEERKNKSQHLRTKKNDVILLLLLIPKA